MMIRTPVLFILLCVAWPRILVRGSSQLPRGASPAEAVLYATDGSGQFTCRDGSKKIPYARVNDDYCDCEDGSDEPGTSACLNGVFYCANNGDEAKTLRSMFVDDGVCDCCDGSDEPKGTCPDVCREIGRETLKRVEQELADAKLGLSKRAGLEKTAANTRKSWGKRLEELENMESSKAQQKAAAEIAKKQAESKLERLKAALKKIEEEVERSKATDDGPISSGDEDNEVEEEETEEDEIIEEEAEVDEPAEEESEEERAKRVASQWIPGQGGKKDHDTKEEEDVYDPEESNDVDDIKIESPSAPEATQEQGINDFGPLFAIKMWIQEQIAWITGQVDIDTRLALAKSRVEAAQKVFDKARDEFYLKQSDLTTLENEKSTLEKKLKTQYGQSHVFLPISESCVEATIDKYLYKICPFGDALQGENGRNTLLGTWSGFEENGSVMNFANGEGCWQGPSRSIKVSLVCGSTDVFESASEPSRCTYTGVIKTPAYCTEELIQSMENEVARRKSLLTPEAPKEEL